jgi:hypothetical protein
LLNIPEVTLRQRPNSLQHEDLTLRSPTARRLTMTMTPTPEGLGYGLEEMLHSLVHAWPVWTHHRMPLYVCGDDVGDLFDGLGLDSRGPAAERLFRLLAGHGIKVQPDGCDWAICDEVTEVYGCPDDIPMPPADWVEEADIGWLTALAEGRKAAESRRLSIA